MLVYHKQISAVEIKRILDEQHQIKVSTSQLYYILKQMTDWYILVKNQNLYTLSQYRIDTVIQYAKQFDDGHYWGWSLNISVVPWFYKTIFANSLTEFDTIWFDIVSSLTKSVEWPKEMLGYATHNYFCVWYPKETMHFYKHLYKQDRKTFIVHWADTFLDLYWRELCHTQGYFDRYLSAPLTSIKWYGFNIIWPMIVEVYFSPIITDYFDHIFDHTTSLDGFDQKHFRTIFSMKLEVKCTIKYDVDQANAWRLKIKKYF